MVRGRTVSRKKAFTAALVLLGKTHREWAQEQGVTASHLSLVLNGRRESGRLIAQIDAVIAKQLPAQQLARSA